MITTKVKLLVDEIANDGNLGITKDVKKVLYNIKVLYSILNYDFSDVISKREMGVTAFLLAGRFICYVNLKGDMGEMLFVYTNKEIDRALDIVNILFKGDAKYINDFMKVHDMWLCRYTEKDDCIELHIQ